MSKSYVGKLLVAPPCQMDEFWEKSVIYLYEESAGTTVGLILNKVSDRSVKELAEHHNLEFLGPDMINVGGPLNPTALVMLHTDDWACTNTMQVDGNLRISSDRTMLSRISSGDTPKKWRMFLGMSGWVPGQLDKEIAGKPPYSKKSAWLVASIDEKIMFEEDSDKMWKKALELAVKEATESYFHIN